MCYDLCCSHTRAPESNPLRLGLVHSILLGLVEIILVAPMP